MYLLSTLDSRYSVDIFSYSGPSGISGSDGKPGPSGIFGSDRKQNTT